MSAAKDIGRILKELDKQGFRIQRTKKCHFRIFAPVIDPESGAIHYVFAHSMPETTALSKTVIQAVVRLRGYGFVYWGR